MKLVVGGDFSPTDKNKDLFINGEVEKLYTHEIINYLQNFDYRIFDLETVFGEEKNCQKIKKNGPYIISEDKSIKGILGINPSVFILANNHTNNFGPQGIKHTIDILNKHEIQYVGAGCNLDEAQKAVYLDDGNVRIGVLAFTENEFNCFDGNYFCMNVYDPLEAFDIIKKTKKDCDYLVVAYHGGMIDCRYPYPQLRRVLRKMVDSGADMVIGQHTHCIGCEETYKGKKIIYGQGDFLFARPTNNEYRKSGMLIEIDATKERFEVSYRVRIKPDNTIRFATKEEEQDIISQYFERSQNLIDNEVYDKIYVNLMDKYEKKYMSSLLGNRANNLMFRVVNKISQNKYWKAVLKRRYKENELLRLHNYWKCETHKAGFEYWLDMEERDCDRNRKKRGM